MYYILYYNYKLYYGPGIRKSFSKLINSTTECAGGGFSVDITLFFRGIASTQFVIIVPARLRRYCDFRLWYYYNVVTNGWFKFVFLNYQFFQRTRLYSRVWYFTCRSVVILLFVQFVILTTRMHRNIIIIIL